MNSVTDSSDLTRRARVRDAALELFAKHGFEKTTVQAIAEAAEVSPALVIHHYGSKEKLRQHCNDYVVEKLLTDRKRDISSDASSPNLVQELLAQVHTAAPLFNYLARMLVEPGSAGDELFSRLVASTEHTLAVGREAGSITSTSDPKVTAILVTLFGLGQFLMRDRLTQALGVDPLSAEGAQQLTVPTLELLTNGLYTDRALLTAAQEALTQQDGSRSDH